jgi:hypothetical protein
MTAMANIRQNTGKHLWQTGKWQNWQTAMANSYGKTAKNVIIRLIIVAIGVCHDNSAKADLQKRSVPSST